MTLYNIPPSPKVLIFDIDSTLYTCPQYAHEQIDSQVRHFADINSISHDEARRMVSDFRKKWAQEHSGQKISLGNLLKNFGISIETSIEWRKKLFNPADYLKEDRELIRALTCLTSKYAVICVTNNPVEPARKTLEVIGISHLIPDIIGLDTLFLSKPAKEIFDCAIETVSRRHGKNFTYSDCISIGDRYDIDLKLPLELGMGAIKIDSVSEIYGMFGNIL